MSKIICNQMGIAEGSLGMDTSLAEELNLDSLDAVELTITLEDEFNITINDEDSERIITLADASTLIEHYISDSV